MTTRKVYTAEELESALHVGDSTPCECEGCLVLTQAAAQARVIEKLKAALKRDFTSESDRIERDGWSYGYAKGIAGSLRLLDRRWMRRRREQHARMAFGRVIAEESRS